MFDNLGTGLSNMWNGATSGLGNMFSNIGTGLNDSLSSMFGGQGAATPGSTMGADLAQYGGGGGESTSGGMFDGFGFNKGTAQTLSALGQAYVGYQQMNQSQKQMELARKQANIRNKLMIEQERAHLAKSYANSGGANSETSGAMRGKTQQEYVDEYAPVFEAL